MPIKRMGADPCRSRKRGSAPRGLRLLPPFTFHQSPFTLFPLPGLRQRIADRSDRSQAAGLWGAEGFWKRSAEPFVLRG